MVVATDVLVLTGPEQFIMAMDEFCDEETYDAMNPEQCLLGQVQRGLGLSTEHEPWGPDLFSKESDPLFCVMARHFHVGEGTMAAIFYGVIHRGPLGTRAEEMRGAKRFARVQLMNPCC